MDTTAKLYDEPLGRDRGEDGGFLDFDRDSSHSFSSSPSDVAKKTVLIPGSVLEEALSKEEEESRKDLAREAVRRATRKHCSQSETVVSIRRTAAVERLSVDQITLTDPTCRADKNVTHWILRSPR